MTDSARKTRAILLSDIQGYSRMMGQDESLALRLLDEHNAICVPLIKENGGTILKFIGDAILASFESASEAVQCGISVQRALALRNASRPEGEKIIVRIGIHIGDVVLKDGDAFGDGVNIAARIEPLAEPGGIAISQTVYDMIKARPEIQTVSLGAKDLKNIKEAVNIYKVLVNAPQDAPASAAPERDARGSKLGLAIAVVAAVILAAGGAALLKRRLTPGAPPPVATVATTPSPAAARPASKKKIASTLGKAGIEWVLIPGGSFMMGSDRVEENPAHRVTLKPFEMSRSEVTIGQYAACAKDGACSPAHVSDGTCRYYDDAWKIGNLPASFLGDDQPVVCVSWQQAKEFAAWAGGRLPSEAQWEYAARSAGKSEYPWGAEQPSCFKVVTMQVARGCGRNATWPVCSKPEGDSEQGLCDMLGNADEWVADWFYGSYEGASPEGAARESPEGISRVIRGGSWMYGGSVLRAASRPFEEPAQRTAKTGFRVVR